MKKNYLLNQMMRDYSFILEAETDNYGDTVYVIDFDFRYIDDLIELSLRDAELEEFLYSDVGSGDTVQSSNGGWGYIGADIQDYL